MSDRWSSIDRIVALGLDGSDGHVRITRGSFYAVYMGSEKTHEGLARLCRSVEAARRSRDGSLGFLSAEALVDHLRREAEVIERGG